jgi:hypothetical protein
MAAGACAARRRRLCSNHPLERPGLGTSRADQPDVDLGLRAMIRSPARAPIRSHPSHQPDRRPRRRPAYGSASPGANSPAGARRRQPPTARHGCRAIPARAHRPSSAYAPSGGRLTSAATHPSGPVPRRVARSARFLATSRAVRFAQAPAIGPVPARAPLRVRHGLPRSHGPDEKLFETQNAQHFVNGASEGRLQRMQAHEAGAGPVMDIIPIMG